MPHVVYGCIFWYNLFWQKYFLAPLNIITLCGSYASCTMAALNQIMCVILVIVATFNDDMTSMSQMAKENKQSF